MEAVVPVQGAEGHDGRQVCVPHQRPVLARLIKAMRSNNKDAQKESKVYNAVFETLRNVASSIF
jgi:hypothetical protein